MEHNHQYLLECFKCSYDELIFRIKHRDAWVKTHLLVQFVITAMATGINVKVVESSEGLPIVLSLALPASLILFIFYLIEENTISSLSRYIAGISKTQSKLTNGEIIHNFDSSEVVTNFFKNTQKLRVFGQFLTFFLIPILLFLSPIRELSDLTVWELLINAILGISILTLIVTAHINRQHQIERRMEIDQ